MTEEITAALAKIPDLRLVARGSAFQFRDEKRDRRAVAQALGATHLIEGSVRREGDRVRIMAQLIEADRGVNVWTESYDRQLASVFATQEDIATSIAGALRMPLGLRPGRAARFKPQHRSGILSAIPPRQGAVSRPLAAADAAGSKALNDAIALLEQVVARNPDYAPAWALLAAAHRNVPNYSGLLGSPTASVEERRQVVQSALSKAEPAARKAIRVGPQSCGRLQNSGEHSRDKRETSGGGRASVEGSFFGPQRSGKSLRLQQLPGSSWARQGSSRGVSSKCWSWSHSSRSSIATERLILWLNGQDQAAIEIFQKIGTIGTLSPGSKLQQVVTTKLRTRCCPCLSLRGSLQKFARRPCACFGWPRRTVASPQDVKRLGGSWTLSTSTWGRPSKPFGPLRVNLEAGSMNFANRSLSHPSYGPARKTERYKAYVRNVGLVDYWRARGWPDLCRPSAQTISSAIEGRDGQFPRGIETAPHLSRGAAYAVVAWVLLQLVDNHLAGFRSAARGSRNAAVLLLLVIGFPVALLVAWTHRAHAARGRRGSGALEADNRRLGSHAARSSS